MRQIRKWLLRLIGGKLQFTSKTNGVKPGKKVENSRTRSFDGRDKQLIAEGVKNFMDEHYELRFNVMKQAEEFRPRFPEKSVGFHERLRRLHRRSIRAPCALELLVHPFAT